MHDIILLRALDLTYAKEPVKFKDRMFGRAEGLVLKDVTFHLYKGEVLGILSDYETLYYLKEVVNGTLDAAKGRVKTKSSILSLDVMDHIHHPHPVNIFVSELLDEYMNPGGAEQVIEELNMQPLFRKTWTVPVKDLSRREIALILIELSKVIDAEIIIYCNMYRHLNARDAEIFKNTVNVQEKAERGVLLLESDIEPIRILANYFVWLSYGQVRYDGSVKKGVARYDDHMRKKSQLKSVDEEALFDLEWKQNVSEYALYTHDLKRLSRNQTSLIDRLNIKKIIVSIVLLFVMTMAGIIIVMNINFDGALNASPEQSPAIPEEETGDRTVYGVTAGDDVQIGGTALPYLTLVQINERDEGYYTVVEDGAEYEVDAEDLIYFNPASLYPETSLESLLPYTNETFRNNYLFYTRYLNGETAAVTEGDLNLSASDEQHADVAGIPITYHFRDGYVFSMSFPAENITALQEEFSLNSEDVIFRLQGSGYMILDGSNETWLYIGQ